MLDNSILVTGTVNLANAALNGLMAVIFVVCLCFFTYYWMRKAHSDEMDQKKWEKRLFTVLVSLLGGELSVVILRVILSYYNINV